MINLCLCTTFPRRSLLDDSEKALMPMWSSAKKQEPGRSPGFSDLRFAFPPAESGSGISYLRFSCSKQDRNYSCGAASDFPGPKSTEHGIPFSSRSMFKWSGTPDCIWERTVCCCSKIDNSRTTVKRIHPPSVSSRLVLRLGGGLLRQRAGG